MDSNQISKHLAFIHEIDTIKYIQRKIRLLKASAAKTTPNTFGISQ